MKFLTSAQSLNSRLKGSRKYLHAGSGICWYDVCLEGAPFESWDGFIMWIGEMINFFIAFAGIVAVILMIWGGITYMTAGGDPEKIDKGTKIVTNTVIGLIIVLIAILLVNTIIKVVYNGGSL